MCCFDVSGYTIKAIEELLILSEHTIRFHIKNIIKKTHATNKTYAIAVCIANGYITFSD